MRYYKCTNCESAQGETEFGECAECSKECLVEISEEEFYR